MNQHSSTASLTKQQLSLQMPYKKNMPFGFENRSLSLLEKLEKINSATQPKDVEEYMHNFTSELLQLRNIKQQEAIVFRKGDENLLTFLEQNNAIQIILNAINRFNGRSNPEFHNSGCIALVHFAFQSKERSRRIYQQGGFHCIVRMMQTYRDIDYIQIITIAALMVIGRNVGIEIFDLEATILQQIVLAMEFHEESSNLYTVACSALGTLFGPGSQVMVPQHEEEIDLYYRALDAICYGLVILHLDDNLCQRLGRNLLCSMVGQAQAEEMMLHVETSFGLAYTAAAA